MNNTIKKLASGDSLLNFCRKNPVSCTKNKNALCKKTLELAGYKTPGIFNRSYYSIFNEYCELLKEIKKILEKTQKVMLGTPDVYQLIALEDYCGKTNSRCSNKLLSFLEYNGVVKMSIVTDDAARNFFAMSGYTLNDKQFKGHYLSIYKYLYNISKSKGHRDNELGRVLHKNIVESLLSHISSFPSKVHDFLDLNRIWSSSKTSFYGKNTVIINKR